MYGCHGFEGSGGGRWPLFVGGGYFRWWEVAFWGRADVGAVEWGGRGRSRSRGGVRRGGARSKEGGEGIGGGVWGGGASRGRGRARRGMRVGGGIIGFGWRGGGEEVVGKT